MTDFRKGKRYRVGVGLGLALLAAGTLASAEEVYTATLTAAKGLGKKTAELTVTITSRTSEEDAAMLQKILQEQGSDAAIEAIRRFDRGVAKITGGPSSPIRHVRAHPGQNGSRVIIITDGPLYFPEDTPSPSTISKGSKSSVGLIELVVDNTGKGRGNMVEALKVNVTPDGVFQVVTPGATKIDLENVQQKR
ncbi:MAG TPA: hypothetical protein VJH87_14330 [Vicinamibacteria bacterium]|nr:hypothetical protein [Vicinamibacteria bacterium]